MNSLKDKRMIALLLLSAIVAISTTAAVNIVQRKIPTRGTVYVKVLGLEAYWDLACTTLVREIDWGILRPSDVAAKTLYLKNTGNTAVTLSMATENWNPPEAGGFISVTWDAEGSTLAVNSTKAVKITLTVASGISGISSFSHDMIISGGA